MLLVVAFAFIWLLAVVKVFLLEKSRVHSEEAGNFVSEFASRPNADDDANAGYFLAATPNAIKTYDASSKSKRTCSSE